MSAIVMHSLLVVILGELRDKAVKCDERHNPFYFFCVAQANVIF